MNIKFLSFLFCLIFLADCAPPKPKVMKRNRASDIGEGKKKRKKRIRNTRNTVECDPDLIGCDSIISSPFGDEEIELDQFWNQGELRSLIEKDPNARGKVFVGQKVYNMYRTFIRPKVLIQNEEVSLSRLPFVIAQPNTLDTVTSEGAMRLYDFILVGQGFIPFPNNDRPPLISYEPTLTVTLNGPEKPPSLALFMPIGYEPIYYNMSLISKKAQDCWSQGKSSNFTYQEFCNEFKEGGIYGNLHSQMGSMSLAFHKPIPNIGWKCLGHIASNGSEPLLDCQSRNMGAMMECFNTMEITGSVAESYTQFSPEEEKNAIMKSQRFASNCVAEEYVAPGRLGKVLYHINQDDSLTLECKRRYGKDQWAIPDNSDLKSKYQTEDKQYLHQTLRDDDWEDRHPGNKVCKSNNKVIIRELINADHTGLSDSTNLFIAIPEAQWPSLYEKALSNQSKIDLSDEEREAIGAWVFKKSSIYMLPDARKPNVQ